MTVCNLVTPRARTIHFPQLFLRNFWTSVSDIMLFPYCNCKVEDVILRLLFGAKSYLISSIFFLEFYSFFHIGFQFNLFYFFNRSWIPAELNILCSPLMETSTSAYSPLVLLLTQCLFIVSVPGINEVLLICYFVILLKEVLPLNVFNIFFHIYFQ